MKEIAVISLSRYGDHIQSTPLLRILRRTYPQARITMVAEQRFGDILPLMGGFDRHFLFDKKESAWKVVTENDPIGPYLAMDSFVRQLEADRYDLVINLTFTKLSAYLVSCMSAGRSTGIAATATGQKVMNDPWGIYFFSTLRGNNRRINRLNIVDIFTRVGGLMPDGRSVELTPTTKGEMFAEEFLRAESLGNGPLVGIQLGASEKNRCWPVESFASLSDHLQGELGCRTILFGSPGEKDLADRARAAMRIPPIDAVGKTGIEELFSLVGRCRFLISNDTGTMHFAAAAGVPSIMLCIGPAFFQGTGPYLPGCLALVPAAPCYPCAYNHACPAPLCRDQVSVDSAIAASSILLGKTACPDFDTDGVRVYRSRFDDDGYLAWDNIHNPNRLEDTLADRYRAMWKYFLDHPQGPIATPTAEATRSLRSLMDQGMEITAGILAASARKPIPVERIKELGEQEAALEQKLKLLGIRRPELAPIVEYLTIMRENIAVEELGPVAAATRKIYETGSYCAGLF